MRRTVPLRIVCRFMLAVGRPPGEVRRSYRTGGDRVRHASEAEAPRREVLVLPGIERAVGRARRWVRDLLGADHPSLDEVAVCTSELLTNALRYTDSGRGGNMRVELAIGERPLCVAVIDEGGAATVPHLGAPSASQVAACGSSRPTPTGGVSNDAVRATPCGSRSDDERAARSLRSVRGQDTVAAGATTAGRRRRPDIRGTPAACGSRAPR
jgi:anti-sigma regulatory factor (Ser/Thr protein kinase)